MNLAVDAETRASESDHGALRLWLRLFTCKTMIEREVRERLRGRFGTTLARFDLLAQLERTRTGMRMSELSRRLMVTGGNVTGITDQLVAEGLVVRRISSSDRRVCVVRLTPKGRRQFDAMAAEHERWIVELVGGLSQHDRDALYRLLGTLKAAVGRAVARDAPVSAIASSRGGAR
jgi:DNA-binding MarR family transcriptional regulator